MRLVVPGRGSYDIRYVVLDMNGTVALDGRPVDGVAERLGRLREAAHPVLLTADTHGTAAATSADLGLDVSIISAGREAEQKLAFVRDLGAETVIAIGNGANDALMLRESAIGICVIGREGAATSAVLSADVVVTDIGDALDLLLAPQRLLATLRV